MSGLTSEPARTRIETAFSRPITVAYAGKTITVAPTRLGADAGIDAAVSSALAATPGSDIALPVTYSKRAVTSFVAWLARRYDRKAVDATLVGANAHGPVIREGKPGLAVNRGTMSAALTQVLESGNRAPLQLLTLPVPATKTRAGLRACNRDHARREHPALLQLDAGRPRIRRRDRPRRVPDPGRDLRRRRQAAQSVVAPADDVGVGERDLQPVPPGPGNPLGTRWIGPDRTGRRHPRDAGRRLDRLLRLARLHPHARPRRGVAVRPRAVRHPGRHPLVGSLWSLWSRDSILSVGSDNSILSIGSVGSILSIGSIGSAASALSIGSAASSLSVLSAASFRSLRSAAGRDAVLGESLSPAQARLNAVLIVALGAALATAGRRSG